MSPEPVPGHPLVLVYHISLFVYKLVQDPKLVQQLAFPQCWGHERVLVRCLFPWTPTIWFAEVERLGAESKNPDKGFVSADQLSTR